MTAFSSATGRAIETNIRTLFGRLAAVSNKTILHSEFLNLFVASEARQMFADMATLSETGDERSGSFEWSNGVSLTFFLNRRPGAFAPPVPRRMVLQPDASPELVEDITNWSTNGGDPSGDFGRVMKVFQFLNEELTRSQMRFVWPSIVPLVGADKDKEFLMDLAQELSTLKAPTIPPVLPHGLLKACRRTAATVSLVGLVPLDAETPPRGQVTIKARTGAQYKETDIGEFCGLT